MKVSTLNYLEETVSKYPNKIAIEDENGSITFCELKESAIKIAVTITKYVNDFNKPIGVLLPKSKESIVSFLGVNYSGNFYIPLDLKSPNERLSKIVNKLSPSSIITNLEGKQKLLDLGFFGNIIILKESIKMDVYNEDIKRISKISNLKIDTDPIYSIFTSGSTGTPKGVLISYKGVIDYIEWAKETYGINEKEIIFSSKSLEVRHHFILITQHWIYI